MVQRLLQYPTQHMNPLIRSTLHHIKLKSQNFLQRIDFDIIQDEEKLILNIDQGRLWFPLGCLNRALTIDRFLDSGCRNPLSFAL